MQDSDQDSLLVSQEQENLEIQSRKRHTSGREFLHKLVCIDDPGFTSDKNEIERYSLRDGDVLFNRTNSPELVGKTATYRSELPAIAAGYLIVVRCNDRIVPELLTYFLNSPAGRAYCWQVKSDGVSQSNINAQKLADFEFRLPSWQEQAEIVRRLDASLEMLRGISARISRILNRLTSIERGVVRQILHSERRESTDAPSDAEGLLVNAQEFKMTLAKKAAKGSKPAKRRASTTELLMEDLNHWPTKGLTFEELEERIPREYEELKEALFSLMLNSEPLVRQEFHSTRKLMVLRRA